MYDVDSDANQILRVRSTN